MAYTTINYKEFGENDLKYESVEIHYGQGKDEKKKFFNTGNFVKDWFDCNKFKVMELSETEWVFIHSSSVDHFIMDGAPYDSAYLHMEGDKGVLKYVDRTDPMYLFNQQDIYEGGTEFFVPEGTKPTWEELKEMCK
jgi:predicted glutamine amidotransferase